MRKTAKSKFISCTQGMLINLLERWIEDLIPHADKAALLGDRLGGSFLR